MTTIGIVHPGEMGSAIGAALIAAGHQVSWASAGRSAASRARAENDALADAGTMAALASGSDVLISICPPDAALAVAEELAGFDGIYLDANAISPATAGAVADIVRAGGATYVDGGVIGGPPRSSGDMRLYLSGDDAGAVAELFAGTVVDARVLAGGPTDASAIKMAYAAWTKGSSALLLAAVDAARRLGVEDALSEEWTLSQPQAAARLEHAERAAAEKGWRWAGEMDEIAATFAAVGLPDGFHKAAAAIYGDDLPA
jgi:3-hydroxyisobutyrate dehydrogenase-like beta-hydroxyacid dehydrogenase